VTRKCMQGHKEIVEDWSQLCPGANEGRIECNNQSCRKSSPEIRVRVNHFTLQLVH